jgi:hypothetical protein
VEHLPKQELIPIIIMSPVLEFTLKRGFWAELVLVFPELEILVLVNRRVWGIRFGASTTVD